MKINIEIEVEQGKSSSVVRGLTDQLQLLGVQQYTISWEKQIGYVRPLVVSGKYTVTFQPGGVPLGYSNFYNPAREEMMTASTHQLVKEILYQLNTSGGGKIPPPDMINHQFTGLLMGAALATNHLHLCRELNTLMKREWIADPSVPAEYSPEKMAERLAQALKQKGRGTNGTK